MSAESDRIFARIARRYDLVNRILSLGRDQSWRREGARRLPPGPVLDLGAGTGVATPVFGARPFVALDPVTEMLRLAPGKRKVTGVGERLPFAAASFDGVFSAFVFRNLASIAETLEEIHRVLRPGGRAVVVDLSRPRNRLLASIHRLGSAIFLPLVGLLAGAPGEYWYLHRSLDALPQPDELYADARLRLAEVWRMGPLGFVYGVVLEKPETDDRSSEVGATGEEPGVPTHPSATA